jgi:hypothetical protein
VAVASCHTTLGKEKMAQMDDRTAKAQDLNSRLMKAEDRLKKIKQNPYYDKDQAATVQAQINRTKAGLHKVGDPTERTSFTQKISPTDSKVGPNTRGDKGPAEYTKDLRKTLAERKAKRKQMLKSGGDTVAKYQREKYYKAGPEKPGMSGSYVLDQTTGKWKKK